MKTKFELGDAVIVRSLDTENRHESTVRGMSMINGEVMYSLTNGMVYTVGELEHKEDMLPINVNLTREQALALYLLLNMSDNQLSAAWKENEYYKQYHEMPNLLTLFWCSEDDGEVFVDSLDNFLGLDD